MCEGNTADLEIVAGTYEEFLLGYTLYQSNGETKLEQRFADHSHKGSIRAVAMHGRRLASGGVDEIIHLYDLITRRETGELVQHSGTVSSLCFTPDGAFLMSASEDGSLTVFRVATWFLEKIWHKAHKGSGVNALSIHPSGKVALTVGNDGVLRTWNLVKGRQAYATNIARKSKRPESIYWSNDGDYYVLPYDTKVDIYSVETAGVVLSLELPSKISSVAFIKDDTVCFGAWDGTVYAYRVESGEKLWELPVAKTRIKALAVYEPQSKLISATSEGVLSVYDTASSPPKFLTSIETLCRITCLAVGEPSRETNFKKNNKIKTRETKENKTSIEKRKNQEKEEHIEESVTPKKRKKSKSECEVQCSPRDQKWKVEYI